MRYVASVWYKVSISLAQIVMLRYRYLTLTLSKGACVTGRLPRALNVSSLAVSNEEYVALPPRGRNVLHLGPCSCKYKFLRLNLMTITSPILHLYGQLWSTPSVRHAFGFTKKHICHVSATYCEEVCEAFNCLNCS